MAVEVTDEEFEELVEKALARVPKEFTDQLENIAIVIEEESPRGRLLGLYHGVPLTKGRGFAWELPDVITIYQKPLQRISQTLEELEEQVYVTVVHEIGHYFGLDDERLHELDWG